jgi:hypothetical protein
MTDTDMLDWSSIEPLLSVEKPAVPVDGHGTHVAGIIGADLREEGDPTKIVLQGMCPDIKIMDLRIISDTIEDTEFAVIGALQLVRYLNSHNQYIVVHGVNLSLSIPMSSKASLAGGRPSATNASGWSATASPSSPRPATTATTSSRPKRASTPAMRRSASPIPAMPNR